MRWRTEEIFRNPFCHLVIKAVMVDLPPCNNSQMLTENWLNIVAGLILNLHLARLGVVARDCVGVVRSDARPIAFRLAWSRLPARRPEVGLGG